MLMLSIAFALFRYLQSFFLEGKIQPFALELGLVHTNMTFTEREKAFGNQIFFSSNRLQYASISDKTNYVVQMGDCGRTSINEDREVINLPPIEDGDRHFIRGEYRPVDSYGDAVESVEPIGGNTMIDKGGRGGIIEERKFIQNPDTGKMEGSTSDGGDEGGSEKTTTNAAGQTVKIVEHIETKGEPNSITQKENSNGGIDRNYYGPDGHQTKQISNHDHGHPKQHPFGKHGEHAHDYVLDKNGISRHGKAREMTDEEKKDNGDMI